jgi:hypothetical protein
MSEIVACACGCGEPAPIARKTNAKKGHVKGMPMRFLPGHNSRILGRGRAPYEPLQVKRVGWSPFAPEIPVEPTPDPPAGWRLTRFRGKGPSTKPAHVLQRLRIMKRAPKGNVPYDDKTLAATTRGGLNAATLEAPSGRRAPGGATPSGQ